MRHPELIVGALLLNEQGEVLVARFSKMAGQYAIPGGHAALHLPLTFTTRQAIEFYLTRGSRYPGGYDPGKVD